MRTALRRFARDIKARRNVDVYVVAAATTVFAALSLLGDAVSEDLRWAALLGGVGLLVYNLSVPERVGDVDALLKDRADYDVRPLSERLKGARELCVFAPTAINFLSSQHVDTIRGTLLARSDGSMRVVVLDSAAGAAVDLAAHQLDDAVEFHHQDLRTALAATEKQLQGMASWRIGGAFDYRLLAYNPGFSLIIIDPGSKHGQLIVELHGFYNEATSSRMHLELTRSTSERWFAYWVDQFEHIWRSAHTRASASP